MSHYKTFLSLVLIGGFTCSALADFTGDFSGSFAPVNWSTSTSGNATYQGTASVNSSQAPTSITIIGASGSTSSVTPLSAIDYSIPLPGSGPQLVSFDYNFNVPNGSTADAASVLDNGLVIANLTPGSSSFSISGTYFAGDTLDLRVYSDNGPTPDSLTITSVATPEPSTLALGGLAGAMLFRQLRRKSRAR